MKIILSKPIPPEGRKPTAKECEQFRKQNLRPTTTGSWRVKWCEEEGIQRPLVTYYDKRSSSGVSFYFEIIEPPVEPKPTKPIKPASTVTAILTGNGKGPEADAWFW